MTIPDVPEPTAAELLEAAFEAASDNLPNIVGEALRGGRPLADLSVVVERRPDGRMTASCVRRSSLVQIFANDLRIPEFERADVVQALASAPADQLPIVAVVHTRERLALAVRHHPGPFAAAT